MKDYNKLYILDCGCSGVPRPALEHQSWCPLRLSFFGAPSEWGVAKYGEKRTYKGVIYEYGITWKPIQDIKMIRKEKLKQIDKNNNENTENN